MVSLALAVHACRPSSPTVLEPVHQLLDAIPGYGQSGVPAACDVDDDLRPALGCPVHFPMATESNLVADGAVVTRRYRHPVGRGSFIVQPLVRVGDHEGWREGAPSIVDGPRDEIEVSVPVPSHAEPFAVSVYLTPAAPGRTRAKTRPVAVGAGAVLRVGIGLDRSTAGLAGAPVEFRLVARAATGERELLRTVVDPADPRARRWSDSRIPLTGLAGASVRFAFATRTLARSGRSAMPSFPLWAAPHILEPRPRDGRPNVLLISVDTLRADELGAYGCDLPTSPNLDRIAAGATLFENVIATYPATATSHASMFTSTYPSVHGVFGPLHQLPAGLPTITELVAARGYETAAVTEDGMLLASAGFRRGFAYYREHKGADLFDTTGQVDVTFADGLRWLEAHRGERFFLFLHTYQVHAPYSPPAAFDLFKTYRSDGKDVPITETTDPAIRSRHAYAGEVRYVDSELRRLLDGLAALGEADRTLLVVTSDHGEEFREHGMIGHGLTLYDEVLRVPLIVRAPGLVPAGLRVRTAVSLVDLMPTVLDLLAIPRPPTVQGESLVPLLHDPDDPRLASRALFSELRLPHFGGEARALGVRTATAKWIFHEAPAAPPEVYDLRADPGEHAPLPATEVARLADGDPVGRYRTLVASATARLAGGDHAAAAAPALDERTVEKLRALGYVQ